MKKSLILLIEDDPNDQELTRLSLDGSGVQHELVVLQNGEEALDYLQKMEQGHGENLIPSLAILDLKLPKMSGFEILKELRGRNSTKHMPVVIFTSSKEEKDIRRSYELGANAFVRKPIEFTDFSETIKGISAFWLKLNHLSSEA